MMPICDANNKLTTKTKKNKVKNLSLPDEEIVLCVHCKRTSSNGIRCLGMCVADNDY